MTTMLVLARDFLERMANPAYGATVNEDHSFAFARLLESERFKGQITSEVETLEDIDTLTSYGWLWLIGWAKANDLRLSDDLLLKLFAEWSSVFVRSEIVDLATMRTDERDGEGRRYTLDEFPNYFLRRLLISATTFERPNSESFGARDDTPAVPVGAAESTLVSLMQVGRTITIAAAFALLHHGWPGQRSLVEFFWSLVNNMDGETREAWLDLLDPPPAAELSR